jgi:hypothetical protein
MRDVTQKVKSLKATERAFEVDLPAGASAAVRTATVAVQVERGDPKEGFLPVKVSARHVGADGGTHRVNGVEVRVPAKYHSLSVSGLAEGTIDIENEVAIATADAVERARRHLVALEAWFKLPADAPAA